MSSRVKSWIVIVSIIAVGLFVIRHYVSNKIPTLQVDLGTKKGALVLREFLKSHDRESVFIDVTLRPKQNRAFARDLNQSNRITIQDNLDPHLSYRFLVREDGKREFVYDEKKANLKAVVMVYLHHAKQKNQIIELNILSPADIKALQVQPEQAKP